MKSINPLKFRCNGQVGENLLVKLLAYHWTPPPLLLFFKLRVLFNASILLNFYINIDFSCIIPLNVSTLVQWNFKWSGVKENKIVPIHFFLNYSFYFRLWDISKVCLCLSAVCKIDEKKGRLEILKDNESFVVDQ